MEASCYCLFSFSCYLFFLYPIISWSLKLVKLVAWSLALRRFCPPDERHVPWSSEILRSGQLPIGLGLFHLTPDLLTTHENLISWCLHNRSGLKFGQVGSGESISMLPPTWPQIQLPSWSGRNASRVIGSGLKFGQVGSGESISMLPPTWPQVKVCS